MIYSTCCTTSINTHHILRAILIGGASRLASVFRAELTVGVLLVTDLCIASVSTPFTPEAPTILALVTIILPDTHSPDDRPPHPAGVNLGGGAGFPGHISACLLGHEAGGELCDGAASVE